MKKIIMVLTDSTVEQLFRGISTDYTDKNRPVSYARYRLLLLLMLHAGLRVGEAVQLLWSDLMIGGQPSVQVSVRAAISKNGETRFVPMNSHLVAAVSAYYAYFAESNPPHLDFFIFQSTIPDRHISVRQVQQWLARISEDHCNMHITPHMLRHTFATRMMATAPASTVQLLLGHKRLSSTQIYLHPTLKNCIDAVSSQKCL